MTVKRRIIAAAWIAGATVPLLVATLFAVGCCVLPFHSVMHKLMPLCHVASSMFSPDDNSDDATTPARDKQEPSRRVTTVMPQMLRVAGVTPTRINPPTAPLSYRSFISLGAIRCDRDVGLHVLDATFLI